jgi:hypothetical protein
MSQLALNGSALGTSLQQLLMCKEIVPGASPSYQTAKTIYSYHPLGKKMADSPISMAMSQKREIAVPGSPEERVIAEFQKHWKALGCDKHIFNTMRLSRIYGIASCTLVIPGVDAGQPVDYKKLPDVPRISFNVLDPLNTAGSLVLNQDPNSPDFQKAQAISVQGTLYHRSRSVSILNEDPLYIEYTASAFGFVGRSVYQRALFPLKSFVQTMVADDMVSLKAGLLIAMMKGAGAIIDRIMQAVAGVKRALLQEAQTNNVLSIEIDEKIETLNMQNVNNAMQISRKDILENCATAADMPAIILNAETFAEGFGEGTEDAKYVASYIDGVREQMQPLYDFFDPIVMHRAWSPGFYKTIQRDFPDDFGNVDYEVAFTEWKNNFTALWPSLLTEPESEKIKVDDVRLRAIIAFVEVILPAVDPENKATLLRWAADNLNENQMLFQTPLVLDWEALASYQPETALKEPEEARPFAATDSQPARLRLALDDLSASVSRLPARRVASR